MIGGSATVTDDWPACSPPWLMIVRTGGLARRAVAPLAPTVPSMCGANGERVAVRRRELLVFVTGVAGSPSASATTVETPACTTSGCA